MQTRYIKHFFIISIFLVTYALLSQFVYEKSGLYIHRALVWNVFLAVLPLLFINLFLYTQEKKSYVTSVLCLAIWFFLFPNVPYLISDFIHITPIVFYKVSEQGITTYLRDILPWIELMHIAIGIWFGMLVGYYSLFCLQDWVRKKFNVWKSWCCIVIVCLLSGYGVFLGRFLRLNSWDVFHPRSLMIYILKNMDSFTFLFTIYYSGFILITYAIFYSCFKRKR